MHQDLTLVSHKLCPYVQRAAIAFAEKGVSYARRDIDLGDKPDWFLAISPLGKVPLLQVRQSDGVEAVLFESNVICEWIEETQPGARLHPANALRRAQHRAWMEFGSAALSDIYTIETTQDPAAFETKHVVLAAKFRRVEAALGDGPWFGGSDFGLVDAVFAPVFRYFDLFDQMLDLEVFAGCPRLVAWRRRLADRPSVRSAVGADYNELLRAFVERHGAYLLRAGAR